MNILLGAYVGSTAFVWVDTVLHQIYLDKRLKKEGYKRTQNSYFGFGDVLFGGLFLIALSIPVFNLIFPLSHINKDRSYDVYKNYLEESGAIEDTREIPEHEDGTVFDNDEEMIMIYEKYFKPKSNNIYYRPINTDIEDSNTSEKNYTYKKILK